MRFVNRTIMGMGAFICILCSIPRAQAKGGPSVQLTAAPSSGFLAADQKQNAYLKVGLKGLEVEGKSVRPAVNAAIVLDKSGSMAGEKIERAKEAARMFVGGLQPNDIVSIVLYSSTVEVLIPATKVQDKAELFAQIDRITADGNTALFAGVSKGAAEVRKFIADDRINRIVLLSDGLANVGPSSPGDLAALGTSLVKEGISVTTIGLGEDYNEDLMTQLALKSDGNHAFIQNSADLARVFGNELGAVLKVVAKDVEIQIRCAEGVRPIRVLGRDAEIDGQVIRARLNQLYGNHERYVVVEVELPSMPDGAKMELATAEASYLEVRTNTKNRSNSSTSIAFSASQDVVKNSVNREVMIPVVEMLSTEQNYLATQLRDLGKVEEARVKFLSNADYLKSQNELFQDKSLEQLSLLNGRSATNLDAENWKRQRKVNLQEGSSKNAQDWAIHE